MPADDIDRLCDLANTASYLADNSCRLSDHADAAKAHNAAFRAIRASKGTDRPSLGQTHLERAAMHDKVASDAESYEQKKVLSHAASRDAEKSNTAAAHLKAAAAHKEAASTFRAQNPNSADKWEATHHDVRAKTHQDTADYLAKTEGEKKPAPGKPDAAAPPASPSTDDSKKTTKTSP